MSPPDFWRLLAQVKAPILLAILVVALVVFALVADERRQCREACLKNAHVDYSYRRENFSGATCDCITRDGRTVVAPQPAR